MNTSIKAITSTYGAIMALAGIEHGIGEILQGNVRPDELMILSWPESEFFRNLAGEPAMTIIPNLRVTGILAVLFSMALLIWSIWFVHRKYGSLVMILLSIAMLLFGGGIFPPILAILIGIVAAKIHSPLTGWLKHANNRFWGYLINLWHWFYYASIIAWIALFIGPGILGYFFGIDSAAMVMVFICLAFGLFTITLITGFARDAIRKYQT